MHVTSDRPTRGERLSDGVIPFDNQIYIIPVLRDINW